MVSREVDTCQLQETPSLTSFINATVTGQILRPQLQRFSSGFYFGVKLQHSAVAGSQLLLTLPSLAANSSLCRRWQATLSLLCRRWQTTPYSTL